MITKTNFRFNADSEEIQDDLESNHDARRLFTYLAALTRTAVKGDTSILPFNAVEVTPLVASRTKLVSYLLRSSLQLPSGGELAVHESIITPQFIGSEGYEQYGVRDEFGAVILENLASYTRPMIALGMTCLGEEILAEGRV